jgi:hypothetical protein
MGMKKWDIELVLEHQPTGLARQIMMIGHPANSIEEVMRTIVENAMDMADDVKIVRLQVEENNGDSILP